MKKEDERLQAEITELLKEAHQADAADASPGAGAATSCLRNWRREQRLAKIREARQRLEKQAKAAAEAEDSVAPQAEAERQRAGQKRRTGPGPIENSPTDKAQNNFTDPELKIMTTNKSWTTPATRKRWWMGCVRSSWPVTWCTRVTTSSKPCRWRSGRARSWTRPGLPPPRTGRVKTLAFRRRL